MESLTPTARRWLTVAETQAYLGNISRSTVHRLAKEGTLIAHKVGGRVLFDIHEIDAAVSNRCSSPTPDQPQQHAA